MAWIPRLKKPIQLCPCFIIQQVKIIIITLASTTNNVPVFLQTFPVMSLLQFRQTTHHGTRVIFGKGRLGCVFHLCYFGLDKLLTLYPLHLRNWWSHGRCLLLFPPHRSLRGRGHRNSKGGAVAVDDGAFETSACFDQQTPLPLSVTKEGMKRTL